jgi:hypothetical protein
MEIKGKEKMEICNVKGKTKNEKMKEKEGNKEGRKIIMQ